MRSLLLTTILTLALAAGASAQDRTELYSNPVPPSREALDRLNLRQAWMGSVEMDGRRDGFRSIQPFGSQLLVQTRSGLTALLDAETGRILWQVRVGVPYRNLLAPTMNSYVVLAFNNGVVYGIQRTSGKVMWEYKVPSDLSAPIVVDEAQAYLCLQGGRIQTYGLPRPDLDGIPKPGDKVPTPLLVWSSSAPHELNLRPVIGGDVVLCPGRNGRASSFLRDPHYEQVPENSFRFSADAGFLVPPGSYEDIAYLGSQDNNLYAISLTPRGTVLWRYTGGAPVTRRPIALENDVYVVSERNGMARLNRANGVPVWKVLRGREVLPNNPDADRFLAANPKFVYAADPSGNLLVLSRERGNQLSSMNTRDWAFPVPNEYTDRLYLAANNGVILCLHDRDYASPVVHRQVDTSGTDPTKQPFDKSTNFDIKAQLDKDYIAPPGLPETMPLRLFLTGLDKQYNLHILIREPVFEALGKQELLIKMIKTTDFAGKKIGAVLDSALAQGECDKYVLDKILIFPAKQKAPEKPGDKPADKPGDKPADKPGDKPADKPVDKAADKPQEKKN